MTRQIAIQVDKKTVKKLDRIAESHRCDRSSIIKKALIVYGKLSQRQIKRRKTNKTLNSMALISIVSMFNALFYYGAFSLIHAVPVFVFMFIFTVSIFFVYKIINRKKPWFKRKNKKQ